MERTVGNIKVRCGNNERGCTWTDDLRELEDHEKQCTFRVNQGGIEGELAADNRVTQHVLSRLQKCEDKLAAKDVEISLLKDEMKDNMARKDTEIGLLKAANSDLREQLNLLKPDTAKEFGSLLTRVGKLESCVVKINEARRSFLENIQKEVAPCKDDSINERNIGNMLAIDWVMADFRICDILKEKVVSPIFPTKVDGYSFQFIVHWEGERCPGELLVGIRLYKPIDLWLPDFDREYTLMWGRKPETPFKVTKDMIEEKREQNFTFDSSGYTRGYGCYLLAPKIENDSLFLSCYIHGV